MGAFGGKCETCRVLEDRIKYLEGLLDRTMNIIAPKLETPVDPELAKRSEAQSDEVIKFGEG